MNGQMVGQMPILIWINQGLLALAFGALLLGERAGVRWKRVGHYILDIVFLLLSITLFLNGMRLGIFVPVVNGYQSLVFFAWSILLIFFFVRRRHARSSFAFVISPLVFALLALATCFDATEIRIPAEWIRDELFAAHAMAAFFAYASFVISFIASALFMIQNRALKQRKGNFFSRRLPPLKVLEEKVYRSVLIGVPLLTVTLVSGFLWSKKTFGVYWVWDPKVIFATVTWILYAFILFLHYVRSFGGVRVMTYAFVSFSFVVITFVGVDVFQQKIHGFF